MLAAPIVTSLNRERADGRSLALLKPDILDFTAEEKTPEAIAEEAAKFTALHARRDLFNSREMIPYTPCPYRLRYRAINAGSLKNLWIDFATNSIFLVLIPVLNTPFDCMSLGLTWGFLRRGVELKGWGSFEFRVGYAA